MNRSHTNSVQKRAFVQFPEEITPDDHPLIGGKAANLARIPDACRVPDWFVLTTEAFQETLRHNEIHTTVQSALAGTSGTDEDQMNKLSDELQRLIVNCSIPDPIKDKLTRAYRNGFDDQELVSVRSSAVAEDRSAGSFAGMHDSCLFLRTRSELFDAVRTVWASACNRRAMLYRQRQSRSIEDARMAVVIQLMIKPSVSGVLFTVNPTTENPDEMLIQSVFGVGEGIVSGELNADSYIVNRSDGKISAEPAQKKEKRILDPEEGGSQRTSIPSSDQERRTLTDDQVRALAETGETIREAFNAPQDIEFCYENDTGTLYILQSRPITTLDETTSGDGTKDPEDDTAHFVWDNSNIIESYSGVTTPMTFSFIQRAYTIVYRCFCEVMGIPEETVRKNMPVFEHMLGLFRGEVYYNLKNWYRLIRLFPGYEFNREYMETMMGVEESLELEEDKTDDSPGWFRTYFVELPKLIKVTVGTVWNFIRIKSIVGRFEENFERYYDKWEAMDFSSMSPHELIDLYDEMEEKLLWNWKAPIINDFFVMIFYGLLKTCCESWCGDDEGTLQNELMCGEGDIETRKATYSLIRLALLARETSDLEDRIVNEEPEQVLDAVRRESDYENFREQFNTYLEDYGFRCMDELKLEEKSLRDDPTTVFKLLRNYLSIEDDQALDLDRRMENEKTIRREAEEKAYERLSFWQKPLFSFVLRCARLGVKNRENMRFARTRIYGLLRNLLRSIGTSFAQRDLIDQTDDIFYLTLDEVKGYLRGTAVTTRLSPLIQLRREEFASYQNHPENSPDDRFETTGLPYVNNSFRRASEESADETETTGEGDLNGTGCCTGEVEGPVKVIDSPDDDMELSGEILVAERTDPGWVSLYPSVSAILIERGSLLSHSAIVAREMGIPAIVEVSGLTDRVQTGDRVRMNGSTGEIVLMDKEKTDS